MGFIVSFREVFTFFLKRGIKAKRSKLFFLLSLIPVIILLIAKIIEIVNPNASISAEGIFSRILLIIYIQLLIPILSLFFGTSVVNEEIDNKTLIFLTTAPIPKPSIILGKFCAFYLVSSIVINMGLLLSFLIINVNHLTRLKYYNEFLLYAGAGLVAILSYMALFTLLGSLFKKSMILGLLFIFGWESIVQYLPGTTQKFTLIHFVKSLLPESSENIKFLVFRLEPSPAFDSIIVLIFVTLISLILASLIFTKKEYILSDHI